MSVKGNKRENGSVLISAVVSVAAAFSGVSLVAYTSNLLAQETAESSDLIPCYRPDDDTLNQPVGRHRTESFADYLYISHAERDSLRHVILRFYDPYVFDGKVHSNDTIRLNEFYRSFIFQKRVTTSTNSIEPPNNHARFDEGWGYGPPVYFPDHADEIRRYSAYDWGTYSRDSLIQLVLSGNYIYKRECGLTRVNGVDSIRCYPTTITSAPRFSIPPEGVIFVNGKVWISASRGRVDLMDGEFPERSHNDGGFVSDGFSGQLTIGSSDTMIITDNLVYQHANADFSVPATLDSCSDILGLVSERYIMIGRCVTDTVYVNAAMAALAGSFSVQDIYRNNPPGWDNEKQSLFVWGSIAQRNRGIIHTTDYPPGHARGFMEKDYHYDLRFRYQAPPHFPLVQHIDPRRFEISSDGDENDE